MKRWLGAAALVAVALKAVATRPVRWLRPARTVTGADGSVWEIWVRRYELKWDAADYVSPTDYDIGETRTSVLLVLLEVPIFLVTQVLVPLVRLVFSLPGTLVRGRRSRKLIVEAINFFPAERRYRWSTTRDHLPRVLDQVEQGLRDGEAARPLGAVFLGGT
jgi:hypothetical protein